MKKQLKTIAIIVAAGKGKRMGKPKQFMKIVGEPMLFLTVKAMAKSPLVDGIIVVVEKENITKVEKFENCKIIAVAQGGKERQESVKNGLDLLPRTTELVLIHDGARPAITNKIIEKVISVASQSGGAIVGVPVKDTIKEIENPSSMFIKKTFNRKLLWQAQTPQVFQAAIVKKAYQQIKDEVTDNAMMVEKMGIRVKMVMGSYENFKVTTPEDLVAMTAILKKRRG